MEVIVDQLRGSLGPADASISATRVKQQYHPLYTYAYLSMVCNLFRAFLTFTDPV